MIYLTLDQAVGLIDRWGLHIRDAGLLGSALARPATAYGGTEVYPEIPEKAAVLLESLVKNHALFDGNKRTSAVLTQLFLEINGYVLDLDDNAYFDLVVGVAAGTVSIQHATDIFAAAISGFPGGT